MLTIRAEQMETLQGAMLRRFEDRLVEYSEERWPEKVEKAGEELARQRVASAVKTAQSHGLEERRHLAAFVDLAWLLGGAFDREVPWARQILRQKAFDAGTKVSLLLERAGLSEGGAGAAEED